MLQRVKLISGIPGLKVEESIAFEETTESSEISKEFVFQEETGKVDGVEKSTSRKIGQRSAFKVRVREVGFPWFKLCVTSRNMILCNVMIFRISELQLMVPLASFKRLSQY